MLNRCTAKYRKQQIFYDIWYSLGYLRTQRRHSKYIWGRSRRRAGSQNGELWCILGAFAVQLVALYAKSSAYERIEQTAGKQLLLETIYIGLVAFCVELNVTFLN